MKSKIFYSLVLSLPFIPLAQGQTTVKGQLVDSKGYSLPNITISVADYKTKSDENGFFELYYPNIGDFEMTLSGLGYRTDYIKVVPRAKRTHLQPIVLHKEHKSIDQVDIDAYKSLNNKIVSVGKGNIADKDLPQAVQIITSQVIADQQVNTLADALKNANGIALGADRGGVNENFYARGYSLGANNIFKNGARTNNGGKVEASTLESVEILKGSSALLYGGVSGGAVLNMVTKKPKFDLGGEVSMRYGSWDNYKPTLDI